MRLELGKTPPTGRGWAPDALVAYLPKFDEYGLVVHDGGSSIVQIHFCPWCGTRLPESRRDQWFEELEKRGIDPLSDHVPPELQSDAWYRRG
jgi:Domain of unknown function (DUF6980)